MGFEEGKRTGAGGSERTMRGRGGKALALPARDKTKASSSTLLSSPETRFLILRFTWSSSHFRATNGLSIHQCRETEGYHGHLSHSTRLLAPGRDP